MFIGCENMFKNVEELRNLIRQGKTNEEIIKSQIEYLNSDKYGSSRHETIKEKDTDIIIFHEGFINKNMNVSFTGNRIVDIIYYHDDTEIYDIVINLIRDNMDKKGFSINHMMRIIRNYFSINEDSPYKQLYDFYKEKLPNQPFFMREHLPYIITNYKCSNFDGDIIEFGKAYLYNIAFHSTNDEKYKQESERYRNSIDWDKLDEIGDIRLNLSDIKGAGLAACTEYAFLEQNILSFLGYEVYMVGGKLKKENGKEEAHNFNVIKKTNGNFEIIDTAQVVKCVLPNIHTPEELIGLKDIEAISGYNQKVYYYIGSLRTINLKH